jgi:outer membrane protein assembly factor BamB
MRTLSLIGPALLVAALGGSALADDWPQWNGPNRNGVSPEKGLLKEWPKGGPKLLWTFNKAGNGYSAPAVVGDRAYLMGARGDDEFLIALNDKGEEAWALKIGPVWDFMGNNWSRGPNGTPSVDGDLVFAVGSQGILVCSDTKGKEQWRKDLRKEMKAQVTEEGGGQNTDHRGWGYSWSPLVDGDKLIILPGGPDGLFAALDKKSGKELWRSKDVKFDAAYASPVAAEIGGVRQYIAVVQEGLVAVDTNGKQLWTAKPKRAYKDMVCDTPVVHNNHVFVTATKANSEVFQVTKEGDKFTAAPVWSNKELPNFHGGVVLVDGNLYGAEEGRTWKCLDFLTGTVKWTAKANDIGAGSLIAADGKLFLLSEEGEAGLIEASPAGYKELGRFKLPQAAGDRKPGGKVWPHPVVANGRLYLRDQEFVFCYQVK